MPASCSKYLVASVVAVGGLSTPASAISGYIVNRLSGKCLDVAAAQGNKVQLEACDTSGANADQLWELTADGFLKHVHSSLFLDIPGDVDGAVAQLATKVSHDPFTVKQWELTSDGHMKNLLNGKCLDVRGSPGTKDGSGIQLLTCEDASTNTDQLWKFSPGPTHVPPKFSGYVVNRLSGKCLDVVGAAGSAEGAKLQLYTCPGSRTDQVWELTSEGLLRNVKSDKCLDLEGESTTSKGAVAQLGACEDANSKTDQRWELTADGHLRNMLNGKCLDVYGVPGTQDGSPLQLWKCDDASSNTDQLWVFFAAVTHLPPKFHGYVVNRLSGKCLDVDGAVKSGDKVQLLTCDTAAANTDQVWELTADGFLRNVLSQRCLDLKGDSTTEDGALAQLAACGSESSKTDQMWEFTLDGHFKNLLSGKCLDVNGAPGTEDGSHLQLGPCEDATGNTDQLWVFMATPPLARALFA